MVIYLLLISKIAIRETQGLRLFSINATIALYKILITLTLSNQLNVFHVSVALSKTANAFTSVLGEAMDHSLCTIMQSDLKALANVTISIANIFLSL